MSGETSFQVQSWDEKPVHELAGSAKISRARVLQVYSGGIEGQGTVEYVMFHKSDGSACFVGIEHFEGAVDGKTGSLVLQHVGIYEDGVARSDWLVVADSGTAALQSTTGSGSFEAGHDMTAQVRFKIDNE